MSKNMTRKGLAFGAGFALVASGLAAAPAQADGITGFIPLAPTTKPATALAAEARDGETFQLQASPAGTVVNDLIKFKVDDPEGVIVPGANTTGAQTDEIATGDNLDFDDVNEAVTFTTSGIGDGQYLVSFSGDLIATNGTDDEDVVVASEESVLQVSVNDGVAVMLSENDLDQTDFNAFDATVTATFVKGGSATEIEHSVADSTADFDSGTTTTVTVDLTGTAIPNGDYLVYPSDQKLIADDSDSTPKDVLSLNVLQKVTVESQEVTITSEVTLTDSEDGFDSTGTPTVLVFHAIDTLGSARGSDNSFVVDSGQNSAGDQPIIELETTLTDTKSSATVTAFVDLFTNGTIDTSEYVSEPVTVQFVDEDDLTVATTLVTPNEGDQTLVANVTTVPMLNEGQLGNSDWIRAIFTRQDSDKTAVSLAMTQNDTTGVWSNPGVELDTADDQFLLWPSDTGAVNGTGIAGDYDGEWGFQATAAVSKGDGTGAGISQLSISTSGVVTVTTTNNHGLRSGDKIDLALNAADDPETGDLDKAVETGDRTITVTGDKTFTYTVTETGPFTAETEETVVNAGTLFNVETYANGDSITDRLFSGDHSARAVFETTASSTIFKRYGASSESGTLATAADDVLFTTVGSASVQAISDNGNSVDANGDLLLLEGTSSATVTATVLDEDGDPVGAGRNVALAMSNRSANVLVNGEKTTDALVTDASGQVTITVTSSSALKNEAVDIQATAEGVATSSIRVKWVEAALSLIDLNTSSASLDNTTGFTDNQDETRTILEGSSYEVELLVADQWYTPADSADYRIKVSGSGVSEGFYTLTDGKATVTISDTGVSDDFNTVFTLQKAGTTGVFADTTVVETISTKTNDDPEILLGADGSSLYGMDGSETADLSDVVALKALVERDTRTSFVAQPAYTNSVVVTGKVVDDATNVALGGAVVTVSGPSNVLFANGSVESRGSITFLAGETNGEFDVTLYSTTAQADTEITVTSMGVSETVDVTFTGQSLGEATNLEIVAADFVSPASTFQVTAKLTDELGNGVSTGTSDALLLTKSGAGITFGTLPNDTDVNGEATFNVLLGANDSGTITITASYDQNDDGDFTDAKDITVTKTITIGDAPATQKVNAGSFKGYVAVYALGYEGQRLSAKIGNDWVIVDPIVNNESDNLFRVTDFTGAGVDIQVRIYIDRVLIDTIPLTTK